MGSRYCTRCGAPAELKQPLNESSASNRKDDARMTQEENIESAAFAGAQRAAGYIELEHTMHGEELRKFRGEAAAADLEEELTEPEAKPEAVEILPQPPAVTGQVFKPAQRASDAFAQPFSDLATATTIEKPAVASRGMRGAFSRIGIRMAPGAAETAELRAGEELRREEQTIRQATWTRAVSVLVANRKGGVGKTPVSLLLGGVLAAVRGGSVAIIEVSDDPGALTFRAEGNPLRGIGELVRDVDGIRTAGQLAGYTAPQTSFASVIGSTGQRARLTGDNVRAVSHVVDEFYGVRVMDSGNQPSSSAFQGALETADALVIPVLNAGDAVLEAVALLEELRAAGGKAAILAGNAIIIRLTDGRPEHPQVVEQVARIIDSANVRQVFEVPYDAHIAERGQLTLNSLAPATRQAFTAAAAGVVSYLQHSIR